MSDTATRALLDALNGDRERVDPAVRRGLVALAREVDANTVAIAALQKRVTIVGGSISTAFFTAAAALFSRLI